MKEKIIQIIPIQANFWGSLKSGFIALTDRGNIWLRPYDGNWSKVKDLPKELQPND